MLNRWYADDDNLLGPISEVCKALQILVERGPHLQFHLNQAKSMAFWPSMTQEATTRLQRIVDLSISSTAGTEILGSPIGTTDFMRSHLRALLEKCNELMATLRRLPNSHTIFHRHRVCASACRLYHAFRLTPPNAAFIVAKEFDEAQMTAYASLNDVPLTSRSIRQIRLPFHLGGHGFTSLALTHHASYASSLIESSHLRHLEHGPELYSLCFGRFLRVFAESLQPPTGPILLPMEQKS